MINEIMVRKKCYKNVFSTYRRTLKNKVFKYLASISKNVYIDKVDDIVYKYDNTYHSTIKRKPIDIKSNIC